MEKQGMDAGRKYNRAGLLMRITLTLILFAISQILFAQSERQVIPALAPLPTPVETIPETPVIRAFWEGAPAQMAAGERAVFALRITGSSGLPYQWHDEFFMPEVPPGAILAPLPVSAEERAGGLAIKLNLIPLEGNFNLPARTLRYENVRFEIPPLNIRVNGRTYGEASGAAKQQPPDNNAAVSDTPAQFPALDSAMSKTICNTARELWNDGHRAQALAELRRNERDHRAGASLAAIRREAEESLGLFNTENESRLRRKILLGLSLFFIHLVIISLFVCFALVRRSNAGKPQRIRMPLLCAAVSAVLALLCFSFAASRNAENSRSGVTRETSVRKTADFDSAELFGFREGQPVVIMLNSGKWLYVRTNDATGGMGWIPAEAVIFY